MNTLEDITKEVIKAVEILNKKEIKPTPDSILKAVIILYSEMQRLEMEMWRWREEQGEGGYYVI